MHDSVRAFLRRVTDEHEPRGAVLECGSQNINGTPREFFAGCDYTGVDRMGGPGVDVVADGNRLPFKACSFDWVVSTSMLEHDLRPWLSCAEMVRVLMRGGLLVITAPGLGWPEHEAWLGDHYRFKAKALEQMVGGRVQPLLMEDEQTSHGPDARFLGVRVA